MRTSEFRSPRASEWFIAALVVLAHGAGLLFVRLLPPAPRNDPPSEAITVVLLGPTLPVPVPPALTEPPSSRPVRKAPKVHETVRSLPLEDTTREPTQPAAGTPQPLSSQEIPQPPRRAWIGVPSVRELGQGSAQPTLAQRAQAQLSSGEQETVLQRQVGRAARPDCKEAYSHLVLLAVPKLIWDTARDEGCKW